MDMETMWLILAVFCILYYPLFNSLIRLIKRDEDVSTAIIDILCANWMTMKELRQKLADQNIGIEIEDLRVIARKLERRGLINIDLSSVSVDKHAPSQEKYRIKHVSR